MKQFLTIAGILLALALSGVACYHVYQQNQKEEITDTVQIQYPFELSPIGVYDSLANPKFSSIEDVCITQEMRIENANCDSVFRCIPQEVLANVVHVLLKAHKEITMKDVVNEYLDNKTLYHSVIQPQLKKFESIDSTNTKEQSDE